MNGNSIDTSYQLYKKYFSLKNRAIEISLVNNTKIKGVIAGFYHNENDNDLFIDSWYIITENVHHYNTISTFVKGQNINHQDIKSILFYEDNTTLQLSSL